MQISLDSFEQYVPESILERGLGYFKKGKVGAIHETSPGHFKTLIEGTDLYTAKYRLSNNVMSDYSCTCPYDSSLICKHLVAVMFHLQQDRLQPGQIAVKKTKKESEVKKSAPLDNHMNYPDIEVTDESCREQVKHILHRGKGREGFIDWDRSPAVGKEVGMILDTAERHLRQMRYKNVLVFCSVILEEMAGALNYTDDSSGSIGDSIERALGLFNQLASAPLPENIRILAFNYCLKAFKKDVFDGWDWQFDILEVAIKLLRNKAEGEKIIALLNQTKLSEFDVEKGRMVRYNVMEKIYDKKTTAEYLEQNIAYRSFRKLSIEHAISDKNYDKAAGLAYAGIKIDGQSNWTCDWHKYLLKIAQKQNNDEKIVESARYLFLHDHKDNLPYFDIAKAHVKKEQWRNFVKELAEDAGKNIHYNRIETIAYIFTSEKQWDRLVELLTKHSSFDNILQYEKFLQQDYSIELAVLYEQEILTYLITNVGRGHYVEACRYIRRIIKLGLRDKAEVLIKKLKMTYPQRRALVEELGAI